MGPDQGWVPSSMESPPESLANSSLLSVTGAQANSPVSATVRSLPVDGSSGAHSLGRGHTRWAPRTEQRQGNPTAPAQRTGREEEGADGLGRREEDEVCLERMSQTKSESWFCNFAGRVFGRFLN